MQDEPNDLPSIPFCSWSQHGQVNPPHISLGSHHYVHPTKPRTRSPQPSTSTSPPILESNALSYPRIPSSWYLPITHPRWLILSLGLPTRVSVKYISTILRWQITYHNFVLHVRHMFHKCVVKKYFHVVSSWQVRCGRFRPHGDKGVSKRRIIGECQRLLVGPRTALFPSGLFVYDRIRSLPAKVQMQNASTFCDANSPDIIDFGAQI